jgi:hypothetical protein
MFKNAEKNRSESEPRYYLTHYPKRKTAIKGTNAASIIPASGNADYCAFPSVNSVETGVK